MDIGDFEKSICELSTEPYKTLQLIKQLEQIRFEQGKQAEIEEQHWIPITERIPTEKDGITRKINLGNKKGGRSQKGSYIYEVKILKFDTRDKKISAVWSEYNFEGLDIFSKNRIRPVKRPYTDTCIYWQPLPEA
jgi:hypothetical protein